MLGAIWETMLGVGAQDCHIGLCHVVLCQAVTYEWTTPVRAFVSSQGAERLSIKRAPKMLAQVTSQPRRLIVEASLQSFWDMGKDQLLWFCRYYGVEANQKSSLLQVIKAVAALPTCCRQYHSCYWVGVREASGVSTRSGSAMCHCWWAIWGSAAPIGSPMLACGLGGAWPFDMLSVWYGCVALGRHLGQFSFLLFVGQGHMESRPRHDEPPGLASDMHDCRSYFRLLTSAWHRRHAISLSERWW